MTTRTPPSGWISRLAQGSLVKQILIGLVLGVLLALVSKPTAIAVGLLGTLFVGALKAVAPVLVLMLVMASIANHQHGQKTSIRPILFLYLLGTFSAALTAGWVSASRAAARVTLRSSSSASRAFSRLRSRFLISDFMIAIRKRDKSHYGMPGSRQQANSHYDSQAAIG